jgi:hypothetical protein
MPAEGGFRPFKGQGAMIGPRFPQVASHGVAHREQRSVGGGRNLHTEQIRGNPRIEDHIVELRFALYER